MLTFDDPRMQTIQSRSAIPLREVLDFLRSVIGKPVRASGGGSARYNFLVESISVVNGKARWSGFHRGPNDPDWFHANHLNFAPFRWLKFVDQPQRVENTPPVDGATLPGHEPLEPWEQELLNAATPTEERPQIHPGGMYAWAAPTSHYYTAPRRSTVDWLRLLRTANY